MTVATDSVPRTRVWLPPLPDSDSLNRALEAEFLRYFTARGYVEERPVALTSGVDPTVLFVGSTASVLKPYVLEPSGCRTNRVLVQPALRTHNLRSIDDPTVPRWTAYFTALGIVARADDVEGAARACFDLMRVMFPDDLVFRASSRDDDLIELIGDLGGGASVELDAYPLHRYRHRYGVPGLGGRNFNFAVPARDGALIDLGNFIVLEREGERVGVEFGIGAGTTLQAAYGLFHPIQAYAIAHGYPISDVRDLKAADCIFAAHALLQEGLRPNATSRGKVLRAYLRAIARLRRPGAAGVTLVANAVDHLCRASSRASSSLPERVAAYVDAYGRLAAAGVTGRQMASALGRYL